MPNEKYKNKYRIQSQRLQTWDYGANSPYFVTICTAHRQHFFGEIVQCKDAINRVSTNKIQLSEIGELAQKYWHEIPHHFPYIELGAFVVMPNHVHGIVIINKTDGDTPDCRDAINRVSTGTLDTDTKTGGITGNKNPMLHDNLSRIIRWYKGRCTFESRKIHANFAWQSNYHDHIIRNNKSYQNIKNYILTNPQKWVDDKFYMS